MPNSLAEEYGYGTSGAGGGARGDDGAVAAVSVSPLTVPPHHHSSGSGGKSVSYEPLHMISTHSSSNSMVTQDVVSHSGSPMMGITASGDLIDMADATEEVERFRRAVTPTKHLRSLDTMNINGFRSHGGGGNPFVVHSRPGGVISEADYALSDDDDDLPTLAAVAPAPPSLRDGGGSPAFGSRPFSSGNNHGGSSMKSVSISATNTTPVRSNRPVEVVDLELEEQIKNLVLELGLNEKSLRMGLGLFNNDLDRAVEWVYDQASDFDMDSQWV